MWFGRMFKEITSKQGTWCFVLHWLCAARWSLTYLYISYISVWRGGSSVFARAVLTVLGEADKRVSYVCDSFSGLPPGDRSLDSKDKNWDNTPYLWGGWIGTTLHIFEVASEIVANNFIKYDLLDYNVVFAKGFFNETKPPLSKKIEKLSVMRLDVSA
jgi:hypothetical protein